MYKEENEMEKSLKDTVLEMRTEAEGFTSDAQEKLCLQVGIKKKIRRIRKKVS